MEIIKTIFRKYKALTIFFILVFFSNSLFSQNSAQMYFPKKSDTIVIPNKDMVLLDKDVFLEYYLSKIALDSIAHKIPRLENKLNSIYSVNRQQFNTLKLLTKTQNNELKEKEKTIQEMKNLIDAGMHNNDECISRLQHSLKYKKQRDILLGSTLIFGTASIILGIVAF